MASEAGSLEHTYGMNIKGDNAYVWNKLAPNNHEYYLGEQKTNDEIENHNDKTNNSDLKNDNECANLDYLLETAEFWEWFSKWSSSYKEIINETIRHLVSQEIVKQFTERNININNIEERRTDKNKIKPESNQTDTSMNVKAHRIYGNSLGSDHVTNIFVFNDINSSNKDDENVIADDNITSNESNETVSDTPVEAPNSTPSTTASITDADSDDDDGSDSIITEDHLNDIISTTNENYDEKVSEPVPKYELYTDLDDYDKTLPLNDDGNSTDKLIDVRSCDVADKEKKGYNLQTITNLVNEEVVKQLTDLKSNKNEKPDKVATKPNANKIGTTMKVDAQTIYGNSLGSDHVTNIFVFFPNTKTLKDITSANSFEKTTSEDGDRNTHKSNAVIGLNLNADLPTIITGHKSTSKGTRLPNRANNVPYEATPELLESATANKSEANKTHKEINTLKDGTYNTLLVNDSETTIQAGNKYLKDSKDISKKEPNTIPVENVTELNNYNIASTTQPITIDDNDQQIDWIRLLKNIAKDPTQLIPIDVRMGYDNDIETISPSEETELVDTVTSAPETEVNDDSKTPKWSNDVVETTEIQKKDKTVINDVINSILKEKIIGIDSNKDDDNRIISNANNKKTISERITTPLPNIIGTNNDSRSLGAITTSGVVITTEIEDSTTASIDAVVTSAPEENVTKIGNVQPSTVDEKRIDWIKLLENIAKDRTQLIPIEDRMENDNDIESISQPEETEIVDTVTSAPDENATEIIDYSTTTTSNDDVAEKAEVQNKDETIINDLINSILMEENIGIDSDKVDDNRIISIENKKKTKSEQISTPLPTITRMNNDSTSSGAMTTKDVEITTEIEDSTTTTTEIENYSTTISVKSIGESEITTKINDNNETVIDTVVTSQPEENIEEIESTTFSVKPTFETVTTTEIEDNKKTTGDALIMPSSNGNVTEMNDDSRTTTSSTDVVGRTEVQKNDETVINDVINSIVMEKRIGIDGDSDEDDNRIITIENEKKTVSEQIITPLPIITGMNNDSTSLGGMTTSNVQIMTENEDGKVTFINSVITSAPEENVTKIENDSTTINVTSISESEMMTEIKDNNENVIDAVVTSESEENVKEIESTTFSVKPTIETVIITETEDNKETTVDALIMPSSNENVTEMNDDSTTTTSSTDVVERTEEQKNDETVINDVINSILMEKRIGIHGDSDEYDNDSRVIAIENEKKTVSEQITTPLPNITGMNNDSTSLEGMTTSNVEIMTENEDGKVTFINAVVTSAPEENVTKIENDSTTISVTSISESEMMTEIKDNNENDAVVTSKSEENFEEIESTTFSVKPTFETVPTTEIEDNKKTTGDALIMPSLNENVTEMNDDSATTTSSTDVAERTEVQKNDETVINDVINSILMEKRMGIDGDGIEDDDIRIIAIENKKKTVSEQITTPLPNITGMNNDSTYLGGMTENEDGKVTLINAVVTSAPEENVTKIEKDSTTISVTLTSENEMMTEIKNNNENVIDAVVTSEPEENIKEIEITTFSVKPPIETVTITEIEDNKETTVDAVVMPSSNKNVTKMNDDSTTTTSSNDVAEMDKILIKQETPNTTLGVTPTSNIETIEIENNIKSVVNAVVTSPKQKEKNVTESASTTLPTIEIVTTTEISDKKEIAPVENVTEMNGDSATTASNINVSKAEVQKTHETALNNIIKSIIVEKRIGIENAEDEDKIINSIDMEKAVTSINSESTTLQAITTGDADTLTEIKDNQETIVNAMITPAPEENLTEIDNDSASLKVLSISNVETATEDNYNDITLLEDFTASMPDDLLEINNEVFKKK